MAAAGFYNDNRFRAFPFTADSVKPGDQPGLEYMPYAVIVDAGFHTGPSTQFTSNHRIWLHSISRTDDTYTFRFGSNAGLLLDFVVELPEGEYVTVYADTPDIFGYITVGDIAALAGWLADGSTITRTDPNSLIVEPALVQNGSNLAVMSINVANDDRTRAAAPDGCPPIDWPIELQDTYTVVTGLTGDIALAPGHNTAVSQDSWSKQITVYGAPGAGDGLPCEPLELFPGDSGPTDNPGQLDGALTCQDVVRSVNGIHGPVLSLLGGPGVEVHMDPDNHALTVNISLSQIAVCFDDESDGFIDISETV